MTRYQLALRSDTYPPREPLPHRSWRTYRAARKAADKANHRIPDWLNSGTWRWVPVRVTYVVDLCKPCNREKAAKVPE